MAPPAATSTPVRHLLRPGVAVVRRDASTIQVGLHPPLAVRLPEDPDVRALLQALREGRDPGPLTPVARQARDALLAADLAFPVGPGGSPPSVRAARAQFGADGARRVAARRRHRIGLRSSRSTVDAVADLLGRAGLAVDDETASAWLVVADGPVRRELLDPLVRVGIPHLVVAGGAAGRRVGPFVEPGRTACLRCVDAHEAETDPRRPFLVEQAAMASAMDEPADVVLDQLALAWAVRDLCRYVEGDEPSTWSTTVDLGPTSAPHVVRWLRHPDCGCAWDLLTDLP